MLKPYDKHKNVGEVWVEKTPLHWEFKRIKHVLYNRVEKNSPVKTECVLSLSAKNGVELQTAKTDKGGNKPKSDFSKYNIAYEQDLLVNCMNVVSGSSGVSKWHGAISPVYYALHTRNQYSNIRYYHYLFRFKPFYRSLLRFSKGILMHESDNGNLNTVRMRISMESLNNINIPIPPREEQDQIVKYLDWQTSKINTLIKAKKKQIELLKEQKQAVINKAVTKGLDDTVPMKDSGIEWLGEVPEHWEVNKIKQHFAIKKSIAGKEGFDVLSVTQQGLKVKDISKNEGQMAANYSNYQFVNKEDFVMNHMDLLTGYVDYSQFFGVTSPDYRVFCLTSNSFLAHYCLAIFQLCYKRKIFYGLGQGAALQGRWRLPKDNFLNFELPVPSLEEQQTIVTYLEEKTALIDKAIVVIEKEIELVSEYKTSLISSVITGKLDVRYVVVPEFEVVEEDIPEDDEELEVDMDDSN